GIDLGTTYSLVSVVQGGVPRIIPIDGASTLPSIVAYLKDGTCIVGEAARRQEVLNPTNSFSSTKRIIGKTRKEMKKFDEKCFVSKLSARDEAPADGSSEKAFVQLSCPALGSDASISPDGISALILKRLIDQADAFLYSEADASASVRLDTPSRVKRAVITVPAYFTQQQRDATERAGKLAGLEKVKLLREPEAAALAYGLNLHKQQLVLVFDLGGGTFDVSVLAVGGGFVEVIATNGDSHLGGDDFDYVVVDWLLEQLAAVTSKEAAGRVAKDVFALARLREAALQAKKALSQEREVAIDVPFICGEVGLSVTLTRKKFEALSKKLFLRMLKPLREVAIMAGVNLPGESGDATKEMRRLQKALSDPKLLAFPGGQVLDEVLLVGGATRISAVRRLVRAVTGVEPQRSVNPDEAVCLGAGTMAGILDGSIADMQVMSAWQAAVLQAINEQRKK
ncbi:Hsp70 protein-domain-containing protein, partial [Ochromonadaceae sp. CCMP2298]